MQVVFKVKLMTLTITVVDPYVVVIWQCKAIFFTPQNHNRLLQLFKFFFKSLVWKWFQNQNQKFYKASLSHDF